MKPTDLFVRRPVLAMVISLAILVLGLRAGQSLPVQQYPRTENAVITIATAYFGADPQTMSGFITTPLETAIAQVDGIDYMTSSSRSGISTITVNLRLNWDSARALTEIDTKVNSVRNQLPPDAQQPVLTVSVGQTIDAMYIGFYSAVLAPNQITDYLARVVRPQLQAVQGVQTAELLGAKNFALRAWLDPDKLAALGLTAGDVREALTANDYITGLGTTKGQMVQVTLNASTNLHSVAEFRNLIVKQVKGAVIRLQDVATVVLGADDYESQASFDGRAAVYVGIQVAPKGNLLKVAQGVREVFPGIVQRLPHGLTAGIVYDSTEFVRSSIEEVAYTLAEALLIVIAVVFVFLGSLRSTFVPVVAIPLSLVGAFAMMSALGFSINLLTLLALVLAIGLVVDDAIIVVENVNRHLASGASLATASLLAGRELGGPIVAMTAVLIAVYVPIGMQGGLTGALFTEFAFTLAGAVTISGVVALTLSPMLCSRLLRPPEQARGSWETRFAASVDRTFEALRGRYLRALGSSLDSPGVAAIFAALVLGSIYFLYGGLRSELAPEEDQGVVLAMSTAAPNATLQQRLLYSGQMGDILQRQPGAEHVFQFEMPGQSMSGLVLVPWGERKTTAAELLPALQHEVDGIAGARVVVFQPPPLPGSSGLPVQFVIKTTDGFEALDRSVRALLSEARRGGMFLYLDTDLKVDQPLSTVVIDREKAALLGLQMSDIGSAMAAMLGGGYVNYFDLDGRSYRVIPQVLQRSRLNVDQVLGYYLRAADGTMVPLSAVATATTRTIPQSLNHFQQLNSATIQGVAAPGVSQGQALAYLKDLSEKVLPRAYALDYAGQSRQYMLESGGFVVIFGFALIMIFLALAALFESFRDPLIILLSVPMSIAGALFALALLGTVGVPGASLNIYTEVGLVTLMGLISKHGILIVEVANELQKQGRSRREAVVEAAAVRLRPILMTTAAMVLGVLPLLHAAGAGAVSRFSMGLVIASGLSIGTLFTLFVVPAFYVMIAADHRGEPTPAVDADAGGRPSRGTP